MKGMKNLYIIIPARFGSMRLPNKVLLKETGKYLLVHTLEAALNSQCAEKVFVATDSKEVMKKIHPIYKEIYLTPAKLKSGTERCLYLAKKLKLPTSSYIVNWQADEPQLNAKYVDALYKFISNSGYNVGTLIAPPVKCYLYDRNTVKVIINTKNEATFFFRTLPPELKNTSVYFHIGVYIYKLKFLENFVNMKSQLEEKLKLEQMRIIENGEKIVTLKVPEFHKGIDTYKDYKEFILESK